MNQPNHVISENLVISQPLYDNDQAAQSIYDKYLKECSLIPIRLIEESKETQERPFAGTRQKMDIIFRNLQIKYNHFNYSSLERDQRNRNQQYIYQANYQQDQQYQQQHNNQIRYPNQNIYYHQGQHNQLQNYYYDQYHYNQHRRNQQNYRMEQDYYGHHHQMRRQEQGRRRMHPQPKYGLDQNEIAALSEIVYRQSRASCWDDENKKCSICISHFEENEKIRFLPCLHRFSIIFKQYKFFFVTCLFLDTCIKKNENFIDSMWCIDSWLATKGSCPLCKKYVRSLVQQFS